MISPRSASKRGFTLIEILAVMGMLALLFTIVVSSMSGAGEGQNLRIAATELRSALRYARQHAIANNTTCSVVFGYDPSLAEDPGLFKRNQLYREGGGNLKPTTRERYLRAYAVYSKRAEELGTGLITPWKYLPQGMVFDVEQMQSNKATGTLNALYHEVCRTSVFLYTYSENPPPANDATLHGLVQAISFRADGTVKLNGVEAGASKPAIFITEGSTNALDNFRDPLKCIYRVPEADKRNYVSLLVPVFTGDAFMSMSPHYE